MNTKTAANLILSPAPAPFVDPCPGKKGEDILSSDCWKCGGTGFITWGNVNVAYVGRDGRTHTGRVCFDCDGHGTIERKVKNVRASARRAYNLDTAAYREAVELRDAQAAEHTRQTEDADLVRALAAPGNNDFLIDLARVFTAGFALTENQVAAVKRTVERDAERAAERENATPAPTGRVTVTGRIVSIKGRETPYGYVEKMVVATEAGWRTWGSLPTALADAEVGDTVTFTATVEPAEDDQLFSFFKRPTKAGIVARAEAVMA